ncbi:methyltransferase domain-containing protein [Paenalcaligenes suwonensis]|uniref:methyltransferase domain-containing protein n=1 Tax=Paenalcaligenes suwonensis TaxID=1202713 RepID=UPI0014091BE8|nr:methyltransferase domain-containing protein [Paenalcaligenes suwonensis]NHC62788.1 methyltransferase domain-containing protein [Paenalcaligenes suwonensis]
MDKAKVKQRFRKAGAQYTQQAHVQQHMAKRLWQYARQLNVAPKRVLEIGCGQGGFTQYVSGWASLQQLVLNDLYLAHDALKAVLPATLHVQYLEGDIEAAALPTDLDVVVSAASVQWLVDVPSLLKRLSASLNDGGYVVLSTFGPEQYAEIRQLTGQGLRYYSVAEWQALLSVEYEVLIAEEEHFQRYFASPWLVLKHLQSTGVTGAGQWEWNKSRLREFSEGYVQRYGGDDNAVSLCYHPIYLIARKKNG